MKTWVIVTGGQIDVEQLLFFISNRECHIVGVDGGCKLLLEHSIKPTHIVGDFDTLSDKDLDIYKNESQSMDILNPTKDLTDTHYSLEYVKNQGAEDVYVFGGIGTRFDHSLANVMTSFDYDMAITFIDRHNLIYCLNKQKVIRLNKKPFCRKYKYLSMVPLTETKIEKTQGLKYNIFESTLKPYDSLAISNEIMAEEAMIEVGHGQLLIILSKD